MTPTDDRTPEILVDAHPHLQVAAFVTVFPEPLGALATPANILSLLEISAPAPLAVEEEVRKSIRDLLRWGGYKPTGRGKPASEYLVRAAGEGNLSSINLAVDVCNAVSLHSGLPISVIDLDLADPPFHISIAAAGESFVFNASSQEIDVGGLLCLFDANGPCANAVRDAQRTKTTAESCRTLSVVWGHAAYGETLTAAVTWYRNLLDQAGCTTLPLL